MKAKVMGNIALWFMLLCYKMVFSTDPRSRKFNAEIIKKQWNAYKDLENESKVNKYAEAIGKLSKTENSCRKVFDAFNSVYAKFQNTSRNIFHGNPDLYKGIYKKLGGNIRQMKQSYFEYCENKHYSVGSPNRNQLCEIRQYAVLENEQSKKLIDCIFKGLRYITEDNKLDSTEIKRDFKQVNKDSSKVDSVLSKMWRNSQQLLESFSLLQMFGEFFNR
uniref:Putative long d7 salivary protein n=1 Tax=Psorophora albipes TaxID=869069 RepID=T1DEY7_9DIPT